jgi:hypothetical protein
MAQIAALRASVEKMTLQLKSQGGAADRRLLRRRAYPGRLLPRRPGGFPSSRKFCRHPQLGERQGKGQDQDAR